ncbi:MAG: hypothetical protein RQ733_08015 [Methyloprofundus sp.]|nr:hypothetical protein [Methyloprofundus sp.]
MKIIRKIKSLGLVSLMLILTSPMAMAERDEYRNKHVVGHYGAKTQPNNRYKHQHRSGYYNQSRHSNKHQDYGKRDDNKHQRHFDKHWHKKHHNHKYYARNRHDHHSPVRILFGLQGGDFRLLFRD